MTVWMVDVVGPNATVNRRGQPRTEERRAMYVAATSAREAIEVFERVSNGTGCQVVGVSTYVTGVLTGEEIGLPLVPADRRGTQIDIDYDYADNSASASIG